MADSHHMTTAAPSTGDAAVDGLLAGAIAGLFMAGYLVLVSVVGGSGWQPVLIAFDPAGASPATGIITHLAVAAVYGVVFAVAWRWLVRIWPGLPVWAAGPGYGFILWALAALTLASRPEAGGAGWLQSLPALHFAVAHLAYGLGLAWAISRAARRSTAS
jgi:hypothetical protein